MEEYNGLEVNLAETAAVDDSQEEIIVLEQYQPAQDSDPHNVLSITDDAIRDPMLEADPGLSSDLVYTSPAAGVQAWHELHRCVDDDDEGAKASVVVVGDETAGNSSGGREEMITVMLPDQTESEPAAVPEAIAMETVVTTQQLPALTTTSEEKKDQFMVYEISHRTVTEPEVLYVQSALKDQKKRQQDKLKKQVLRKDPAYRAKERLKSRERMKQRREDPTYREREREKDRRRREFVRKNNPTQREKERERDRNAKRLNRTMSKEVNFLDVSPFFDSVSLVEMNTNEVT